MSSVPDRVAALDRVLELALLVNADMSRDLAARGLTESRVHLLWVLRRHEAATQRQLADALQVSPRNVTGLVDALVETGFVSREPHPTDRRATLVRFTEKGRAVARTLEEEHREFARVLFGGMPRGRFEAFVAGLDEVLDRLRRAVAEEADRG